MGAGGCGATETQGPQAPILGSDIDFNSWAPPNAGCPPRMPPTGAARIQIQPPPRPANVRGAMAAPVHTSRGPWGWKAKAISGAGLELPGERRFTSLLHGDRPSGTQASDHGSLKHDRDRGEDPGQEVLTGPEKLVT